MDDVAKRAGVSKTTVSRVLNRIPNSATPETTERVFLAVDELGYVPNVIAASLKRVTTRTVGLIVGDIENPFFGAVIKGIESTLQKSKYSLILANSNYDPNREEALAQIFLQRQVDAMIVAPGTQGPGQWIQTAKDRNVRILFIDNTIEGVDVDSVVVDNFQAVYQAIQYLIELGHNHIAMISGLKGRLIAAQRTDGFLSALKDNSIQFPPEFLQQGAFTIESGYACMQQLLKLRPRPTAVFAANNFMTIGALNAIHESGLQIPKQISILGFDDMYWYSVMRPSLTAISQPAFEIGVKAAERILSCLKSKRQSVPKTITLLTKLIVRESTGPP